MRDKVFPILIGIFLLGSLAPTFYEIAHRDRLPTIRAFELVHNFPTDYNFYLSRIRQGIEGRLTVAEKYTSELHRGSFIHVFYLWLGWLGRWVRVPWERGGDVYHVARIVSGGLLLVMIAEYCKKAFQKSGKGAAEVANENFNPSSVSLTEGSHPSIGRLSRSQSESGQNYLRSPQHPYMMLPRLFSSHLTYHTSVALNAGFSLIAFLLAVTASTWPKLVAVVNTQVVGATMSNIASWRMGGYMPWWSVMDSLQRITFIPHLLVGQALILFLIMELAEGRTMSKLENWVFFGILGFLLGIVFPPGLLFVLFYAVVLTLGELFFISKTVNSKTTASPLTVLKSGPFFLRSGNIAWRIIGARIVVGALSVSSLVYLSLMTSFYPWKRLAEFDIVKPLPFEYVEYVKAVGPILPVGVVGLIVATVLRDRRMLPSVSWVITWGLLLFVFKFVPQQSPLRFSEMLPHVPLGVLATYVFYNLYNRYNHYKYYVSLIPAGLILLGGGVMYSSWLWQRDFVNHKIIAAYPLVPTGSYVMYPLKDFIAAMKFLQDNTSRDTVILSETTAGNYIPVYSGNTVYVGHANTVRAEQKEEIVKAFYSGRMTPEQARGWLDREGLRVVFYGPQEREDGLPAGKAGGTGELSAVYPFLEQIYTNSFVTVYRVRE